MQMNEGKIIIEHVFENKENLDTALDVISMSQEIREQMIENKENLEVAQDIISMSQEIRGCIIKTFLEKLKDFICEGFRCKNLDMSQQDWKTELLDNPFGGKHRHRYFRVPYSNVSQGLVSIALSNNPTGNVSYIGVFTNNELFYHNMEHLKYNLDKKFESGAFDDRMPWFWYQYLKSANWNYVDWTDKDTLMKMYTETDCVVEDIGTLLLRIIEVAKPEIEEWAQNQPAQ